MFTRIEICGTKKKKFWGSTSRKSANNQDLEAKLRDIEYQLSQVQQETHRKESELTCRIIELEAIAGPSSPGSKVKGHGELEDKLKFYEEQVLELKEGEIRMKFDFDEIKTQRDQLKAKVDNYEKATNPEDRKTSNTDVSDSAGKSYEAQRQSYDFLSGSPQKFPIDTEESEENSLNWESPSNQNLGSILEKG